MALETFGQLWNRLLLYAPGTPPPLAQQFVKDSYRRVLAAHMWSELLVDGEQTLPSWYEDGTVDVTQDSTTVVGNSTAFTADMLYRQFSIKSYGFYTITAVDTVGQELTLDRPWGGGTLSANGDYVIGQFYVEFPSDFRMLDDIRDATRNWRLRRRYHQQNYIDLVDPRRVTVGAPALYVDAPQRIASDGTPIPRMEFWPRIAGGTRLLYRYVKNAAVSASTDTFIGSVRPEAVLYGALADLALWPGTAERPNPFHSMDLHREYTKLAEDAIHASEMADLERNQRMLIFSDDSIGLPADARFLQEHGIPF